MKHSPHITLGDNCRIVVAMPGVCGDGAEVLETTWHAIPARRALIDGADVGLAVHRAMTMSACREDGAEPGHVVAISADGYTVTDAVTGRSISHGETIADATSAAFRRLRAIASQHSIGILAVLERARTGAQKAPAEAREVVA